MRLFSSKSIYQEQEPSEAATPETEPAEAPTEPVESPEPAESPEATQAAPEPVEHPGPAEAVPDPEEALPEPEEAQPEPEEAQPEPDEVQPEPAETPAPALAPPRRGARYWRQAAVAALAILAVLCLLAWGGSYLVAQRTTVFPGVTVEGTKLAGMTRAQAAATAKLAGWDGPDNTVLRVVLPGEKVMEIQSGTLGWSASAQEAADAAFQYGRDRGSLGNLFSWLRSALFSYDVARTLADPIDADALREQVEQTVGEVNLALSDGGIELDTENGVLRLLKGAELLQVDAEEVYLRTLEAVEQRQTELNCVRELSDDMETKDADIEKLHYEICGEPQDAYYDVETREVVDGKPGVVFDADEAQRLWDAAVPGEIVEIPVTVTRAGFMMSDMPGLYADMLSSKSTSLAGSSYNRINNVTIAASRIDGVILLPGETFSYNETVGQRTWEAGFREAGAYSNGVVVQEIGGGICQVSSTLYYCAMTANLEILERTNHYFAVGYIEPGMDATVSWGNPDFKFRNDRTFPIVIHAHVENGMVTVEIWGTDVDGSTVRMGYDSYGLTAVTYRHVYDRDGNLLSSEQEAVSIYHPHEETHD